MTNSYSNADRQIIEALEVLRPGHNDLVDPDLTDPVLVQAAQAIDQNPHLAQRLSRIAHTDEQLASVFHDVVVPTGLEDRLLTRLATAEPLAHDTRQSTLSSRRFATSRLLWASAVAVAASVVVAIFLLPKADQPDDTPPSTLLNLAIALFHTESGTSGTPVTEQTPPADFAASSDVRYDSARWRKIDDFLGSPAIAYDLTDLRGNEATLYVARRRLTKLELVTMPSDEPWLSTGGVSATCWQNGELLYVLVVAGGQEQYEAFVRQPSSTVAVLMQGCSPRAARLAQTA